LKRELDAIGCHVPLEPHGQGYKDMSPAVDIVERLVIQRKLRARVSTRDQDLASQDAELRAAGCAKVFKEKVSGGRRDRPELAKLLRRMEPSDVLEPSIGWRAQRGTCSTSSTPSPRPRRA